MLFCVKFINVAIVTQNLNNIGSNVYVSKAALLPTFLITKKSGLSISAHFHKNSLIVTCCTFVKFKIWTLTPNTFKNQTNDTLKLLGHNYNHERGSLTQKIVTLHCCSFNLKFWVKINNVTFVMENGSNIVSNNYLSTVALL